MSLSLAFGRIGGRSRVGFAALSRRWDLGHAAVAIATGLSAVELALILYRLGGHFSFSLDDPYIHLALADQIAHGTYGLNPGEPAAPSSSILFPLLLASLRGCNLGQFAALAIGFAATLWSSLNVARLLEASLPGLPRQVGLALTAALILSLNLIGLEFTGLEHPLHVAVTLACLLGAIRFLDTGRVAPWWWACAFAEPLIRYEGASLWVGIAVLLIVRGRRVAGAALLAAGALALGLFSLFLLKLGLAPLPSSVLVKSYVAAVGAGGLSASFAASLRETLIENISSFGMVRLGILCVLLAVRLAGLPRTRDDRPAVRPLAALALWVGCAHMLLGRFGWFSRYEIYAVAFVLLTLVYAYGPLLGRILRRATPARALIAALCPLAFLAAYPQTTAATSLAARNIYGQQYQMHRFVAEFYRQPVGVNDLGWVAYGSPAYVLDFWGLGSETARKLRLADPSGRWMDDLARRHEVGLAMIYDTWFDHVPDGWQAVARLVTTGPRIAVDSDIVTFYATSPAARAGIEAALRAFAPTLPPGTRLAMEPSH